MKIVERRTAHRTANS